MRIVAFTLDYPPHRFIGSELMTHKLLTALRDAGHVVVVKSQAGQGVWKYEGITALGRPSPQPTAEVAIVHAGASWPGVEYRQQTGAKLIVICHNTSAATRDDVLGCSPDLIVVNSKTMLAELGVEALVVNPPAPPVTPLPPGDRIVVLSLNNLKGGPQFLRLARMMPHRKFLAVQGGYGEQLYTSLPNVEILDHVPHDELTERVWSRAALFLQLSVAESWGMAASEARAHGIPIIAHPTPGLAENLGGSAVWANRDDTEMLAHVVDQVLSEGKYRRKALARARVIAATSSKQVTEWVAAIERLGNAVDQRDSAARSLLSVGG